MSTRQYGPETTIVGLDGSISALEFSPDGKVLASGCEDGSVTLFSTFNWKPLHTFVDVSPLTSLVWHPRVEGLLFCGFKSGNIHTLQINRVRLKESPPTSHRYPKTFLQAGVRIWTDANRNPIHCLSHDPRLNILAVGSGKGVVLANYDTHGEQTASWSKIRRLPPPPGFPQLCATELPEPTPQSIHFTQGQDSIIVSYLHHGVTLVSTGHFSCAFRMTLFQVLGSKFSVSYLADHATVVPNVRLISPSNLYPISSFSLSGRSCLLADQKVIATTNLFDGVDYYDLENQSLVNSLRMTIADNIIAPVVSGNAGSFIVGGSSGAVHVLQAFPAAIVQTLELESE